MAEAVTGRSAPQCYTRETQHILRPSRPTAHVYEYENEYEYHLHPSGGNKAEKQHWYCIKVLLILMLFFFTVEKWEIEAARTPHQGIHERDFHVHV